MFVGVGSGDEEMFCGRSKSGNQAGREVRQNKEEQMTSMDAIGKSL